MNKILCTCLGCVILSLPLMAQEQKKPEEQKPLELPEFIITGSKSTDVPGGSKQEPKPPKRAERSILDSLNTLEKQPPLLLAPVETLRTIRPAGPVNNAYLQGEFGIFLTPSVSGGWRTSFSGYDLSASAGLTHSDGHLDNAGFTTAHAGASLVYHAPEKFYIFGGSRTETYFSFRNDSYRLFATPDAPKRSLSDITIGIKVEGRFDGWDYEGNLALESAALSQEGVGPGTRSVTNTGLLGAVKIIESGNGLKIGGIFAVDFRGLRDIGQRFMEIGGVGRYTEGGIRLEGRAVLQSTANSFAESALGIGIALKGEYLLSPSLILEGQGRTGRIANSYRDLLLANPYTDVLAEVAFAMENVAAEVALRWQPSPVLQGRAAAGLRSLSEMPLFVAAGEGRASFAPVYSSVSLVEIEAEQHWQASDNDDLTAHAKYVSSSVDDAPAPYIPALQASLLYRRHWSDNLSTSVRGTYIGERYAGFNSLNSLPAYFDLALRADYNISDDLGVFARATNLLGADIYIWEGYRERGLFLSAGIVWRPL